MAEHRSQKITCKFGLQRFIRHIHVKLSDFDGRSKFGKPVQNFKHPHGPGELVVEVTLQSDSINWHAIFQNVLDDVEITILANNIGTVTFQNAVIVDI